MIRFQQVILHDDFGDDEGMLVFVNDRLVAVLSRLGQMHDTLTGRWFIEAPLCILPGDMPDTFATLQEVEVCLTKVQK